MFYVKSNIYLFNVLFFSDRSRRLFLVLLMAFPPISPHMLYASGHANVDWKYTCQQAL